MNLKYVNKYEYTEDMCERASKYVYYRRTFAVVMHILLILISIAGTTFTVYYLAGGIEPPYHYSTYIFYSLAPIAAEIAVFVKYRKMIEQEKSLLKGEKVEITVSADDDRLTETIDGETKAESDLLEIEKVYDCGDFFLVTALAGEYYIFKKGCFIEGDENKFVSDIRNCVKITRKKAIENSKPKQV